MLGVFWFSVNVRRSARRREVRFRPSGGDFQGMRIYRSDVVSLGFQGGAASHRPQMIIVRDESVKLSLGMVASPQSPLLFCPTK